MREEAWLQLFVYRTPTARLLVSLSLSLSLFYLLVAFAGLRRLLERRRGDLPFCAAKSAFCLQHFWKFFNGKPVLNPQILLQLPLQNSREYCTYLGKPGNFCIFYGRNSRKYKSISHEPDVMLRSVSFIHRVVRPASSFVPSFLHFVHPPFLASVISSILHVFHPSFRPSFLVLCFVLPSCGPSSLSFLPSFYWP